MDPEYEVLLKIHDKVALRKDVSVYSIKDDQYMYGKFKTNKQTINLAKCTPTVEEQRFWEQQTKRKESYLDFIQDKIEKARHGAKKEVDHLKQISNMQRNPD